MHFLRYRHVSMVLLLAALVGCTQQPSSQDLKEQTAQATRGCEARCQGCGCGDQRRLSRDKQLDLNTAKNDQLLSLPGMTAAEPDPSDCRASYSEAGDVAPRGVTPAISRLPQPARCDICRTKPPAMLVHESRMLQVTLFGNSAG
jgi:hypothetical protein